MSGPYAESTSISRLTLPLRASLCLNDLSLNLRWSWDHPTIELFRRLDSDLWEQTNHNPWLMLARIDQKRLAEAEADEAFLAHMDRVWANLHEYLQSAGWFRRAHPEADGLMHSVIGVGGTDYVPICRKSSRRRVTLDPCHDRTLHRTRPGVPPGLGV